MRDAVNNSWRTTELGEVCTIVNGGTPKSKVAEYWGGDVQWLTPKDMGQMEGRQIGSTPRTISEQGLSGSSARLVPERSIILSTRAPIGHLAINTTPMAFNQGCRGLIPSDDLDHMFLYHFLDFSRHLLNSLGSGTTFKELSATTLKKVPVPLPPLEEQQRIVAILDEAFEGLDRARENAEANLQNARDLFESFLEGTFDQTFASVGSHELAELIDIRHGFAFKSKDFEVSSNPTLPILLTPGNYDEDARLKFTKKNTKRLSSKPPKDYIFQEGELTVVMTDLSSKMKILGKPAFIDQPNILHNQRIGRIEFKNNALSPRWLFHFLRTRRALDPVKSSSTGTMVRHTAPKRILSLQIPLPSSLEQQQSATVRLDALEAEVSRLSAKYHEDFNHLADLRQSLLRKAFAGELT